MSFNFSRRALLLSASFAALTPSYAQNKPTQGVAKPSQPAAPKEPFSFKEVQKKAEGLSKTAYIPSPSTLPKPLENLSFDNYRDIRFRAEKNPLPKSNFKLQAFHRGFIYPHPISLNIVKKDTAHPIAYSSNFFDFGKNTFDKNLPANLNFAGFRLHYPLNSPIADDELISFLGASYFRFLGRAQQYGLSARGLAIQAGSNQEEFPTFKEFWLEEAQGESQTIYALLESQSLTGAFRFTIYPENETSVDVYATLYARTRVEKIGLAPLTSMFLHGENDRRTFNDYRPELHDSDGLLIHSQTGEFLWRPLRNPVSAEISSFNANNPRGFGLLQRDRAFEHYQDIDLNYENRPSYWIEPREGFGEGSIELVELPTTDETNDNIVASFVPKIPLEAGKSHTLAYKISAIKSETTMHKGAKVLNTFRTKPIALGSNEKPLPNTTRFIVDFKGGELEFFQNAPAKIQIVPTATNGKVLRSFIVPNPQTKGFRAAIDIEGEKDKTVIMRAFLKSGERALSETWTFPWKVE